LKNIFLGTIIYNYLSNLPLNSYIIQYFHTISLKSIVMIMQKVIIGNKVCYKNMEVKELELDSSHLCQEIEIEPRTTKFLLNRYPWTIYMS
jgi:hypothetical protein